MALFDLSVVLINQPLHQIEDQGLVQVGSAACVVDVQRYPKVPRHELGQWPALLFKHIRVVQSFLGLDEPRHPAETYHPAAVAF